MPEMYSWEGFFLAMGIGFMGMVLLIVGVFAVLMIVTSADPDDTLDEWLEEEHPRMHRDGPAVDADGRVLPDMFAVLARDQDWHSDPQHTAAR